MSEPASPFVGLSAFSAATAAYFTGRERFALTLAGALLRLWGIERQVLAMPEQYLWMHKRFKTRPPGEARFY